MVEAFAEIAKAFGAEKTPQAMLSAISQAAARTVPGCDHAGVLIVRAGQIVGEAASDETGYAVGQLQQLVGQGPCVQEIRQRESLVIDDLASEPRWPLFGERAVAEAGVRAMMSFRLLVEEGSHSALNLYSRTVKGFDDNAHAKGAILAVHARIALTAARDRYTNQQLRSALDSNREIGMAMGILMAQGNHTQDEAFSLLAGASQRLNIKLRRIAAQVVRNGGLDEEKIRRRLDS